MRVEILVNRTRFMKGQVININDDLALDYIKRGVAKAIDDEPIVIFEDEQPTE